MTEERTPFVYFIESDFAHFPALQYFNRQDCPGVCGDWPQHDGEKSRRRWRMYRTRSTWKCRHIFHRRRHGVGLLSGWPAPSRYLQRWRRYRNGLEPLLFESFAILWFCCISPAVLFTEFLIQVKWNVWLVQRDSVWESNELWYR